jgi:hypothetical protein
MNEIKWERIKGELSAFYSDGAAQAMADGNKSSPAFLYTVIQAMISHGDCTRR